MGRLSLVIVGHKCKYIYIQYKNGGLIGRVPAYATQGGRKDSNVDRMALGWGRAPPPTPPLFPFLHLLEIIGGISGSKVHDTLYNFAISLFLALVEVAVLLCL